MRPHNACDGCTIRRVKCHSNSGNQPCVECRKRSIECTFLRTRGKPGPKGPRLSTAQKIKEFQKNEALLRTGRSPKLASPTSGDEGLSCVVAEPLIAANSADVVRERDAAPLTPVGFWPSSSMGPHRPCIPISAYTRYIEIFRERLRAIWPVVDCDALLLTLVQHVDDYETRSLAAAVCAAVIAQLRLPEHMQIVNGVSSHQFALDSEYFRTLFNYRETFTISSVIIPFFLHMYYANTQKLRTSGLLLRECVSFAQGMRLDQPFTYSGLERAERALRLRVFWILFVSERTFCAENRLPPILAPIGELPIEEEEGNNTAASSTFTAFLRLIHLFVHLERDFVETSPIPVVPSQLGYRERDKMSQYQSTLSFGINDGPFDETQRVDLFVTRQWIRTLLWEYTVRHFSMSCKSEDQAFSMLLPISIAHETLSLFHAVSDNSLQPHGYGIELKVFRMADSLIDTLACIPSTNFSSGMLVGPREVLRSLEQVLTTVGGPESLFLARLRRTMAEADLPAGSPTYLSFVGDSDADGETLTEQSNLVSPTSNTPEIVKVGLKRCAYIE